MPQTAEQKSIANVYAALTVSLLLSFLPLASAAFLALAMFVGAWIAAYALRRGAAAGSLMADHMTYIIRTIWIAGFIGMITMIVAVAYVLGRYDPTALADCVGSIAATDMGAVEAAVRPCLGGFIEANMDVFINGTMIGGGPIFVYLAYRLAQGIARAVKGHRLGNLKSWF